MFAVVYYEEANMHLVLPINWVNQINLASQAECGVNSGEKHIVFYSADEKKCADFRQPIEHLFDPNNDACYLARIKKFFDRKDMALTFCQKQRCIMPKIYSEFKEKQARQHNAKMNLNQYVVSDTEDTEETDPEKQRIHDQIRAKIKAMNRLHFDLTTEEIDQYQRILDSDDDDNDSISDECEQTLQSAEANSHDSDGNDPNNELDLLPQSQDVGDESNHSNNEVDGSNVSEHNDNNL